VKVALIAATFGSAFVEEGAGWLVRFVSPSFASLKILGLLGLQTTTAVLMVLLGAFLFRAERRVAPRRAVADTTTPEGTLHVPAHSLSAAVDGATLVDISVTGMRLELAVALELAVERRFHLRVRGLGENVTARVVSCHTAGDGARGVFEIGLEFVQMSAAMRQLLSRETAAPEVAAGE
jgi:hypothetical protein